MAADIEVILFAKQDIDRIFRAKPLYNKTSKLIYEKLKVTLLHKDILFYQFHSVA